MNGNLIGAVNTPTLESATGVWDIEELKLAQQQNSWPFFIQPDPDFEYVSLLLSSETAAIDGAQNNTFQDSSTNNFTITRNGNTTQGSFSPYLPNWSNYFNKGSNDYLSVTDDPALQMGSGNFTIECWVYSIESQSTDSGIVSKGGSSTGFTINVSGTTLLVSQGSTSSILTSGAGGVPTNTWVHVAYVRSGTNIYLFANGLQVDSSTNSYDLTEPNALRIGANRTLGAYFKGYISNLRIIKGTAVYTSNFVPPTSPLTAISGTSLLACQSNRFIDNSTNNFTITRNGDTRITPFSPFSSFVATKGYVPATYGGSGYFDGTGDYLRATGAALALSTNDFTLECWFYLPTSYSPALNDSLFASDTTPGYQISWSTNGFVFMPDGGTRLLNTSLITTDIKGAWHHLAYCRQGSTLYGFLDGQLIGTSTDSAVNINFTNDTVDIGVNRGGTGYIQAWISNLRIVSGTAVYTSAFTPPTAPLTAISGTSLLTNFTNGGIIDSAALNVAETVGNAQVSTSVKKYGSGSYYFDGTGDWCTIIDKPELRFGTGAFTVDFWLYLGATGAARGIIGKGTASTGWLISTNSSNNVVFTYGSSTITSTGVLSGSTWYFITVVRQSTGSNQTKIYINGINDGTGTVSTDFNQTNIMYVGADRTGGAALNGYISDLRLTKGVARYTANFTPPTASLPTF
jgi:hypothetical protein